MKASRLLPVTLLFCAAAALLRLWQSLTGFEADTGLPVAGHLAAPLLAAALLAAALLLFFLSAPDKDRRVQASDCTASPALRRALTLGSALFIVSGLLIAVQQLLFFLSETGDDAGLGNTSGWFASLNGLYVPLLTALALCGCGRFLLRTLRGKTDAIPEPAAVGKVPGGLTAALPVLACCLLLVFVYQNHANDPVAQQFLWPELACFCAMPAWYALSALWYAPGNRRTVVWLCLTAAVAQCTALCAPAGAFSPAVLLALVGNLLWFLSCAVQLLRAPQGAEATP